MRQASAAAGTRWVDRLGLTSRVSRRLLLWMIVCGSLGSLAVSAWEAHRDYRDRLLHLGTELESVGAFAVPSLTQSVWTFDRDQIDTQLRAFSHLPYVSSVSLAMPGQAAIRHGEPLPTSGQVVERTLPLVRIEDGIARTLGTLTLTNSLRGDRARLLQRVAGTFVGNALVILLSALGVVMMYQVIVTRRMLALAAQLRGFTAQDLRQLPPEEPVTAPGGPRDELDELAASIAMLKATGRQALHSVDDEHALLRNLMDTMPDLIWLKDLDGRYLACNPRFEQLYGAPESQLLGRDDFAFREPEVAEFFRANDQRAIEAGAPRVNEEWLTFAADGYRGLFETIKTPMRTHDGRVIGVLGVARDITHQRRAAEEIRDREELYRSIVSQAGDGIVLIDPQDGSFKEFNDAACAHVGYSREEFARLTLFDLQIDLSADELRARLAEKAASGGSSFQRRHRHKDGSAREVWISNRPVTLRGRTYITDVWHDITSRHAAEQVLREERRVRESIMESIPGVFYAIDVSGRLRFWNRSLEQTIDRSPSELDGLAVTALFEGEHRALMTQRIHEVFIHGQANVEADLTTRGGRQVPYYFTGIRVEIAGQPMVVGAGIDVSERRQAALELQRLNAELEARVLARTADLREAHGQLEQTQFAMASVGIGIHWAEVDTGRLVYVNQAAADLLDYTVPEMLALRVSDIDPSLPPDLFSAMVDATRLSGRLQFETEQRAKSGRLVPVEVTLYFHTGVGGAAPRLIAFVTDIALRKEAEKALLRAKEDAESASLAKSAFLANMSHEIRTPMNAIIGLTHLMRRAGPTPDQADRLAKIDSSGRHLLAIINDILDLAKIEAGRMELERQDFHLASVLDNVASIIGVTARAKGLAVRIDHEGVPPWLSGDSMRLRQALLNFAGNAVKFTETGRIDIRVQLLAETDGELLLRFQVRDTGPGIAPDKIGLLFHEFEQTDASTTRRHGGTGLGLAISRRLAQLMGGEVGVDSRPGQGSTFWFTARLHRGQGAMLAAPDGGVADTDAWQRLAQLQARVLLVEDNPINREVTLQLLQGSGLTVDTAEHGAEGVRQVSTTAYDLILMDMQMPVMDGLQATRAIRALPGCAEVPILAMTANAFGDDRRACADAGMSDFIAKPVEPQTLYAMLLKWLAPAPVAPQAADRQHAAPPVSPGRASATDAALQRMADLPGMDVARGVASLLGHRDRYLDLMRRFVAMQADAPAQLAGSLAAGDTAAARFLSHSLKGAAATLGAQGLSGAAARLEQRLRDPSQAPVAADDPDVQVIRQQLDALAAVLDD